MRILIVTSESLPGSEDRNLPLAKELIRRGHSVRHTGPSAGMIDTGFTSTVYDPEFASRPEAAACRTKLFDNWGQLRRMIAWAQVVLFSVVKGYKEAADFAAGLSKVVIWLADTSLHPWAWNADLIAAGSPFERDRFASVTGDYRAPDLKQGGWSPLPPLRNLNPEDIRVTGSTLLDMAAPANQRRSREEFYRYYSLDESRKTAVWLPSSPACHSQWFKELYRLICRAVKEIAGFNLIINPHPRDHAGAKQETTYQDTTTPTWKQLAPDIAVCKPEDKWDCFRSADVLISAWTTAAIEAGLFRIPMLFVDDQPFALEIAGVTDPRYKEMLPKERFTPPSRRSMEQIEPVYRILEGRMDPETDTYLDNCFKAEKSYYPAGFPEYIGTECTMEELPRVLRDGLYKFDDQDVYDDYAATYSPGGIDGRAYLRIADLVESVEGNPKLVAKIENQRSWTGNQIAVLHLTIKEFFQKIKNRLSPG